jgi:NADH-quinone oxidoreductase subunit G
VSEVEQLVTVTIDGYEVSVPPGTLVIRAAEQLGIAIPRFCDHPLLDPVGACRQCLVEIGTPDPRSESRDVRWMPKPQASCTIPVSPGMHVRTQLTSPVADKAQQGIMEFLLLNHPLDCPVCDKGGECPLQNQAMTNGRPEARFDGQKRTYPKPIAISSQVLLDRERCVLCARCTRFSDQVAGDPFIELLERGALQQVGIYESEPFESYYSGNTIQICPVGALTSAAYRFRARPFDLVSTPSACEHCASGCSLRTDHRRGTVMRRLAGDDPAVNQEWNCDKGRFAFTYARAADRLTHPLVRDAGGELQAASWPEALRAAAAGLSAAGSAGVLTGGRVTVEDGYAYAKFARLALGTNNVDFRFRAHSDEETQFLAAAVVGRTPDTGGVTYADLDSAPHVLLVGFEPEEESPIVFLRLRRAVRRGGTAVTTIAPFASRGTSKLSATLVPAAPGTEAEVLDSLGDAAPQSADGLRAPGALVLVGERLATVPGGLSAVLRLAESTGARVAWVPRRAGERGALQAGAFPTLLPGGRPLTDAAARVDVATVWGAESLPADPGLDTAGMLAAAAEGRLDALVVGGVEAADLPDPAALDRALERAAFVVSLELRASDVHRHADVVFPVAPVAEKAGTFTDWEGRPRPFPAALTTQARSDGWVLDAVAAEMGHKLAVADVDAARAELDELGSWDGATAVAPTLAPGSPASPGPGEAVLATWRLLLDLGRLQDEEPHLAGTAHPTLARLSAATAAAVGAGDGELLTVVGPSGTLTLPVAITDMPDHVVWLPTNSAGSRVHQDLGVGAGALVSITAGGGR